MSARATLILILSLLAFCTIAQEESLANFTGTRRTFYADGKIQSAIQYRSGRIYGSYITYNEQGKITEQGLYLYNKWVNKYYLYYANGALQQSFTFSENGKRNGLQRFYYRNGTIQTLINLDNNMQQGYVLDFDSLGHLSEKPVYFVNGRRSDVESRSQLECLLEIVRLENEAAHMPPR